MKSIICCFLLGLLCHQAHGQLGYRSPQQYFPVKINQEWGLMDESGVVVLPPKYEAIGEFKNYGYATMQLGGAVGLLNNKGKELIAPKYDDIKVLDSLLFAVLQDSDWMVINLDGDIVLEKGYEQVHVWERKCIAFKKNKKWGIANLDGKLITSPLYDEIVLLEKNFFQTKKENNYGLLSFEGKEILPNDCEQIKIYNDHLFFFQKENKWGAVDLMGNLLVRPVFQSMFNLSENFIKLVRGSKVYLYSVQARKLITKGQFQSYYPFSKKYVLCKRKRQLGLLDAFGNIMLQTKYDEIQSYGKNQFRVNFKGKWGVVSKGDNMVIPFDYDYIAPLKNSVCVVKKGRFLGIANVKGEELVATEYHRIFISDNQAKAYKGAEFTVFKFDEEGNLQGKDQFKKHITMKITGKTKQNTPVKMTTEDNDYQLNQFEWFYSPKEDKWGLRKLEDGEIHIEPTFDWIRMEKDLGFTLVGLEKWNKYVFDRTTYRFDWIFGLVNNENGLLITPMEMLDIRLSDFRKGYPAARVIFADGRHGLIENTGVFLAKDYAYIGEFQEGLASMSTRGKVSGSLKKNNQALGKVNTYLDEMMSSNYMTDYTLHDREFRTEAWLTCEDCEWGYIDTSGIVKVKPQYSFCKDFVNGVGIVENNDKQGAVDNSGKTLLKASFDNVRFLENTKNQILQVYRISEKYGLIDTFGQVTIDLKYDKIGNFSDDRLAVMEKGLWGFVDEKGNEIIPCRYRKIQDFQEGVAAVQLGNKWGFIDKLGEIVIEFKYQRAGNFKDGLAWVSTSSGVCYINKEEEKMILPRFDRAFDFENNVARVVIDGKYGLIKRNGEYFLKPKYSLISQFNEHGLAIVQFGNERIRYGLISRSGDLVTTHPLQEIQPFKEGLAVVKYKGKYGFIDTHGKLVISNKYSKVAGFSEGRAVVQKDGLCGYIDRTGKEVIPPTYSRCLNFKDGNAVVYKGLRNAGLVDMDGNEIIKPGINRLLEFSDGRGLVRDNNWRYYYITEEAKIYEGFYEKAREFQHGVAVVRMNGKWGIINQKGMQIIPPKYDQIGPFENGYAKVRIKGFSGLTNLKGEVIVPPDYEYISYAGSGLFRVEQGDKIGYFDFKGNWVWQLQK